jgi:hypothetical protein
MLLELGLLQERPVFLGDRGVGRRVLDSGQSGEGGNGEKEYD